VQAQTRDSASPEPGWYADPWRVAAYRWWDGLAWTGYTTTAFAQHARNTTTQLPRARDDVRGGAVAALAFAGAIALSLLFSLAAVAAGVSTDSVAIDVVGHAGLWSGLLMGAYVVTHRRPGGSFRDLGLHWPMRQEIGLGIGIAFGALWVESRVIELLNALLPQDNVGVRSNLFVVTRPSVATILITAYLVCIGAPIVEELFFRGLVQGVLTRRYGAVAGIAVQAVLFGCAHYQLGMTMRQAVLRIAAITTVGAFLGWLRHHTGRLGAGMIAHATNNTLVVLFTLAALAR